MFSAHNLALIAGRASRLSERRVRTEPRAAFDADEVARIGARLDLWREEAAGTKPELFARRLAWDAIPEEKAGELLDDEWLLTSEPAEWLGFLGALRLSDREGQSTGALEEPLDGTQIPFASAFHPFVAAALELLVDAPAASTDRLAPAMLEAAARSLVGQLARLAAPVLARAFDEHLRVNGASADPSTSTHYDAFTAFFARREGWRDLLLEFPVLARLMATVCLGWARETQEFLTRLDADWGLIRREFFPAIGIDEPFLLKAVRSEVSDRHGGAGVVRVLEFSTGGRVVYKRRPLDLEADFNGLLRALGTQGLECAPPALRVCPRSGYGWVEHAEAGPVADAASLDLWFRKAGGLLCLMHLLGGNDGHMENVIATASGPVLIDLETLMQPRLAQGAHASEGTFALAAQQVRSSVLQTGLLPLWQRGRYGKLYDIGGLTGAGGYESPVLRLSWENIGTDAVRTAWRRGFARGLDNLPRLEETRHSAAGNLGPLCAGFTETWRFLQANREILGRTVSQWSAAPLRVLLRATTHYAAILERSCGVDALRFGIDRSLIFEALRRTFVQNHAQKPILWTAVDEEIRALEDADIPAFFVRAAGRDLEAADGRCLVEEAFESSALEATLVRLDGLTEANRRGQLEMVAAAFIEPGAATATPPADIDGESSVDLDALLASTPLASEQALINTATILGTQILKAAIRGSDGFVTWLAPAFLQPEQGEQRGVSYYLYDGVAGIALFLAALAKVTGLEAARTTALTALEPIRAILDAPNASEMIKREGLGGCSGLGSLVYTLTAIARLLDVPELIERARRVSRFINDERIARDQALDVVNGSAGAIFALLALARTDEGGDALERAVECGRHLLAKAENVGDDALAWPSWPDRLLLAGYSHGAAGQAAALAALAAASGDASFAEAARAALRYERGLFETAAGNWPILLPDGTSRIASTWCHGAPGIVLSRLGMLGQFGDAEDALLREEIKVALEATLRTGVSNLDHLCCGTMGRVEILHLAAGEGDRRILDMAHLGATLSLRRAQQRKAFALQTDPVCNAVFQPGFFRGTSGIGYAFLRLAKPELVPSVFTWQV